MANISSIPNGEKRMLITGEPVIFDKKSGNIFKYDTKTEELGMLHTEGVGLPGGQSEKSILAPAAQNKPEQSEIKPTFSAMNMPEKKPMGKATITPQPKKQVKEKNINEQKEDEYLNNEWDKAFTP